MRLQEIFLTETTDEDRAIVSLASSIADYINQTSATTIPKIGQKFDTPLSILNSVKILIEPGSVIKQRLEIEDPDNYSEDDDETGGLWYAHNNTIVINKDLIGTPEFNSALSHELRHALADHKSGFKAGQSKKYTTPKDKENRKSTNDPYFGNVVYLAEPAEINARFLEVMNQMVTTIRQAFKLSPEKIKPIVMQTFRQALEHYQIADLFPQKEKSREYKRLVKRGMDFIQKEIQHQELLNNKKTIGNY